MKDKKLFALILFSAFMCLMRQTSGHEVAAGDPVNFTVPVTVPGDSLEMYGLWTGGPLPTIENIPVLEHVKFRVIKKYEPEKDGYRFLHGVAIVRHQKEWIASFGHNKGPENTGSEEASYVFGGRKGKKWSTPVTMDNPPGDLAVSHGVFLENKGTLWSFMGAFYRIMEENHMRAYRWDDQNKTWINEGVVAGDGFWPLQEPRQMENGEWIIGGASVGESTVPAVAICRDGDFTNWEVIRIATPVRVWGESTVIVNGADVLLISRSANNTPRFEGHPHPLAWVAFSKDYGRTWTELQPSNMPMAASKPYSGTLSTGQRYLIGSSTANSGNSRRPLTIALSRRGETTFSKLYCIRHSVYDGPGESNPDVGLSYPYAVEYNGKLWVVYSNTGGGKGRVGKGRSLWNNNSAELAIIPLSELQAD